MLTEDQATKLAIVELGRQGRAASDYNIVVETYHADPTEWIVWFDRKGRFPVPGGKEAVRVHKTTGRAIFMPGE